MFTNCLRHLWCHSDTVHHIWYDTVTQCTIYCMIQWHSAQYLAWYSDTVHHILHDTVTQCTISGLIQWHTAPYLAWYSDTMQHRASYIATSSIARDVSMCLRHFAYKAGKTSCTCTTHLASGWGDAKYNPMWG